MKKVVLCGHSGSNNRGCEAIIRSTVDILKKNGMTTEMGSFSKQEDEQVGLDRITNILEYRGYTNRYSLQRLYNGILKKVFKNEMPTEKYVQKNIFKSVKNSDCALVVGGDTYCYGRPLTAYALNRFSEKKGIKTVLWSCSVAKEKITEEMMEDLNRYSCIFARETITYNNLLQAGVNESKLCLMSDSAFVLPVEELDLPEGFENVFAYNPSYTIYKAGKNIIKNRENMIEQVLQNTDLKIAFIPHVYSKDFGDVVVCRELYDKYKHTDRVFLFDDIYNCMQLKYIISKCRFLVAERTHASIAGYSTCVPTFVLGYSVKSEGIAKDIFGQAENYVYPVSELNDEDEYFNQIQYMLENEKIIKQRLQEFMPEYINRAWAAGEKLAKIIVKE